jgi:O-antigen/teichoic acid export membrane protein
MFRTLAFSTALSAAVFFAVGLLGFLVVPVLVEAYGWHAYGLLALARTLVPTSALALADPGLSEQATLAVSRSRVDGDWGRAGREAGALLVLGLALGVLVALGLGLGAAPLARLLGAGPDADAFARILVWTGLASIATFPGMVLDGLAKGFEIWRGLRAADLGSAVAFAGGVFLLARGGAPLEAAGLAFAGSQVLRALLVAAVLAGPARSAGLRPRRPEEGGLGRALGSGGPYLANRLILATRELGSGPLIGVLLGPASAGVFDALVRVPRFLRTLLSQLNLALLPVASRMEQEGKEGRLGRAVRAGTALVTFAAVPPALAGALCSRPLLELWLGPALAPHAAWQALMFGVTLTNTVASFGLTMILPRAATLGRTNALHLASTSFFLASSVLLAPHWQERAFIAGLFGSSLLVFPLQLRLIARESGLGWRDFLPPALILAVCLGPAAVAGILGAASWPASLPGLLAALSLATLLGYAAAFVVLPPDLRSRLLGLVRG